MSCRACGGRTETVFEMAPMPLAAAFTYTIEAAEDARRYPLRWCWCTRCGLVNVDPDIPDAELYRAYGYAASQVPALVRHHAEFAAFLSGRHSGRLLEIGSNDGVLINQLRGFDAVGVDPSDVATGYPVVNQPFTADLARALGQFDVITSSNAFAHFTGIEDAIEGIALALRPSGVAYIEVHDLAATLRDGQWDTVYHEHKVEWSVQSLALAFGRHGLHMTSVTRLPLHGGLIRAAFAKSSYRPAFAPDRPDFSPLVASYRARRATDAYRAMMQGGVAYGAAARASVYVNQIPELPLAYIVDGSPRRQGKFLPGVALPVVPPEVFDRRPPARTLITAWNHAADIKARHPEYQRWVSAW